MGALYLSLCKERGIWHQVRRQQSYNNNSVVKDFFCLCPTINSRSSDLCWLYLQNLLRSGTCPEIQGFLHVKEPSRKAWKKIYFFLRRSGLYCSTKGSSKVRAPEFHSICVEKSKREKNT